ncbi:hypothetical protein EYC84_008970 [Monilinia fructicola]|uniref:Uncharacterized protein n=1 Tax=Monilinia fructicola TaxID=38448 RepID=A0A5M9JAZ2_MONFR|nr:hypothetical protein EYC84_008970 [Monilinia fructicola]
MDTNKFNLILETRIDLRFLSLSFNKHTSNTHTDRYTSLSPHPYLHNSTIDFHQVNSHHLPFFPNSISWTQDPNVLQEEIQSSNYCIYSTRLLYWLIPTDLEGCISLIPLISKYLLGRYQQHSCCYHPPQRLHSQIKSTFQPLRHPETEEFIRPSK